MNQAIELIKKHEGTGPINAGQFMPYRDSEKLLTIGYGFCIEKTGLSEEECEFILKNRVNTVYFDCERSFYWFEYLTEPRKSVVVSMIYNMGMNGFVKFKKTIEFIESGDYYNASIEMMDSKWAKQVGRRAKELSKMMRTGEWL